MRCISAYECVIGDARWLRYSPSILKLLVSQAILWNKLWSAVVHSLGNMVSPSRSSILKLISLVSLCWWTTGLLVWASWRS